MIFHLGIDIQCNYKWGHTSSRCWWIVGIKPKVSATIMYIWWNVPVILGWVVYEWFTDAVYGWISSFCGSASIVCALISTVNAAEAEHPSCLDWNPIRVFLCLHLPKCGFTRSPSGKFCGYSPPFSHGTWTCCCFFWWFYYWVWPNCWVLCDFFRK
jgi:hypothetical protein